MIEQIDSTIYRIEVPLPDSPLKSTNSYFIRGFERNLLIDNGFNMPECIKAMEEAQHSLNFTMDNTDLFLTHLHSDHIGLTAYLARPDTKVYTGDYTAHTLSVPEDDAFFAPFVIQSGLALMGISPEDPSVHPGYEFAPTVFTGSNVRIVGEGFTLKVGDLCLRCIETTGHAPDHLCLYEERRKLIFTGDHILGTITPNNTIWEDPWDVQKDYLGFYLQNIEKIKSLPIDLALPGHRAPITDCHGRIDELKEHHKKRLNLVLHILDDGAFHTGAQVTERMRWDIKAKSWDDFPTAQKLFATGEALSHLVHLIFCGEVRKELVDGVVYFARVR